MSCCHTRGSITSKRDASLKIQMAIRAELSEKKGKSKSKMREISDILHYILTPGCLT